MTVKKPANRFVSSVQSISCIGALALSLLGCTTSDPPGPPIPPIITTMFPTLPPTGQAEGLCDEGADRDRFFQPSLDAYAALADSIIVGTIQGFSLQDSPVLHFTDHPTEGRTELGTIDAEDCPSEVAYIKVIKLMDVETLYGKDVGSTIEIPLTYGILEHEFGVYFYQEIGGVATSAGQEYFRSGTRIGGLIRTDGFPAPYLAGFEHTMFEVFDETLHLRQPTLACLDRFDPFGIPDEFDGQPLSALRSALADPGPLTAAEQSALTEAQMPIAFQPGRFENTCVEKVGDWPTGVNDD